MLWSFFSYYLRSRCQNWANCDHQSVLRDWNPKPEGCWGKRKKKKRKRRRRVFLYYLCGTGHQRPLEKHSSKFFHTTSVALAKGKNRKQKKWVIDVVIVFFILPPFTSPKLVQLRPASRVKRLEPQAWRLLGKKKEKEKKKKKKSFFILPLWHWPSKALRKT